MSNSSAIELWGIDWTRHYPVALLDAAFTVAPAPIGEALDFAARHYADLHGAALAGGDRAHPARRAFYERYVDAFLMRSGADAVGVLLGHPTDWSTYYIRYVGILPRFQGVWNALVRSVGFHRSVHENPKERGVAS
ncbi:MAG: hypothetical protein HY075_13020 [Deltaproteobacteria bacterium]|nr:hypothetical protein [Deltaproteobacteria bacterium]